MKLKSIFLLVTSITLFSFILPNKSKNYKPPGTVEIATNMFMDETEITNISWQEYMYWNERIYGKTSEEYLATFPDSMVWEEPNRSHYLDHPAYRDYPVVGITWQQAKLFCTWRSDRVMEQLLIKKEKNPKLIIPAKLTYRLPTIQEWERIANASYSGKTTKKLKTKYAGASTANFQSLSPDVTNSTAPVYQYWPNKFGVYNIWGNVAEMTNEEGIAKGGSWIQSKSEVSIDKKFEYKQPTNWIGFRCVCEMEYADNIQ